MIVKQFHLGHQGVSCMKALACGYVYWPNMDKQLEDLAHTCAKCQLAAKSPRKSTLSSWPVPDSPWTHKWAILFRCRCLQQMARDFYNVTHHFRRNNFQTSEIFSRFGVLETLVSDNSTAFSSVKFSTFCQQNSINHVRTPPFHPQSNGQVECLVDTFKRALLNLRGEGTMSEILETFFDKL